MPCSDNDECKVDDLIENTSKSQQDDHQENEYCSPFCICSCCSFHAFQLQIPSFIIKTKGTFAINTKSVFPYSSHYSREISSKCWQPPKLS